INISARDLMDTRLSEQVAALLQTHGCAAGWITLEITESAILDDPGNAVDNLSRLHALGCRLAIDDYGTGYSSLAYLRRLPVDELKIDKSFVLNMARDASDTMIVRSTIELAHNMGLTVVAEGVDDEGALDRLRSLGCDMVQGFLLSRPLTPEEIAARLASHAQSRVAAIGGLRIAVLARIQESRRRVNCHGERHGRFRHAGEATDRPSGHGRLLRVRGASALSRIARSTRCDRGR